MNRDRALFRRSLLCGFAAVAMASVAGVQAQTRVFRLALNGYDPVSYFLPDGPQAGSARFETEWGGFVWRFTGEANRTIFRRDPSVYAPRLGGFDAAGILERRLVDADPVVFALLDGRLYLFRDASRRARFLAEPMLARQAEAIWPSLGSLLEDPDDIGRSTTGVR